MKTKIIPFDLETVKKIQAGEIKGKIKTKCGNEIRILCFDLVDPKDVSFPIVCALYNDKHVRVVRFTKYGRYSGAIDSELDLVLEVPEEAPEEQHPIGESELYQAGYKAGFEAGRCVAFDEKKGCVIKKEASKYDDVEEVPTGDGSIVFLRHKKHEFKPFDKVLVRQSDKDDWRVAFYSHFNAKENLHVTAWLNWYQCIPYEGNENLVGTTDKPKELC